MLAPFTILGAPLYVDSNQQFTLTISPNVQFGAITSSTSTLTLTVTGDGALTTSGVLTWTNEYTPRTVTIQASAAFTQMTINFALTGDTVHLRAPQPIVLGVISQAHSPQYGLGCGENQAIVNTHAQFFVTVSLSLSLSLSFLSCSLIRSFRRFLHSLR